MMQFWHGFIIGGIVFSVVGGSLGAIVMAVIAAGASSDRTVSGNPGLMKGKEKMECQVCGKPTRYYKMSVIGQIRHPLCSEHAHYEPYLRCATKDQRGAMGVHDPADPGSIFKEAKA